jgi:hypothetical protein
LTNNQFIAFKRQEKIKKEILPKKQKEKTKTTIRHDIVHLSGTCRAANCFRKSLAGVSSEASMGDPCET